MDANATKKVGIITGSNLRFGRLPVGSASIKYINITSSKDALVRISATGNISEMLEYDEKFYFQGSERTSIRFNASKAGYYTGKLELKIQTPKNKLGNRWLDLKASLP
ncbi:MAG: hypothetical protein ABEJ69_02105 [Candidatus Nanohaloarchaea archaeon]